MMHDLVSQLARYGGEGALGVLFALSIVNLGIIGLTGNGQSTLGRAADVALVYGAVVEACPLTLAPSTSTTIMLALGDALAFVLSEYRQFTAEEFARFHPAGSLGRKLARVESVMRHGDDLRLASADQSVRAVFAHATEATGAGTRRSRLVIRWRIPYACAKR